MVLFSNVDIKKKSKKVSALDKQNKDVKFSDLFILHRDGKNDSPASFLSRLSNPSWTTICIKAESSQEK